jgi:hypothetical protein
MELIRTKLQLRTQRGSGGAYVIPVEEEPKLRRLYDKYGLGKYGLGASSELGELSELAPGVPEPGSGSFST